MKRFLYAILETFLLCVAGLGLLFFAAGISSKENSMAVFGFIVCLLSITGLVFCIKRMPKRQKIIKETKEETVPKPIPQKGSSKFSQVLQKIHNILLYPTYTFTHIVGLPLRPGAHCKVKYDSKQIIIKGQGVSFTLDKNRITNISIQKDKEEFYQAVSSVGRAIAGGIAFGPIGAAIGGRTRLRKYRLSKYVLVLTYTKDESIQYITFKQGFFSNFFVRRMKDEIKYYRHNDIKL